MKGVKAESPAVRDQARRNIRNSWVWFAVGRALGVWPKGRCIEGRKAYCDAQTRSDGADSFHNLPQEACAVLEAPAIRAFARVCTQEFVTQVSVAMLDIDEIESQLPRQKGSAMKVLHDRSDFPICEDWIVFWQFHPAIKNGMVVQNARLTVLRRVGAAEAARMS